MSRLVGVLAALACLSAVPRSGEAAERTLRGRVVAADGKGVAGASVALAWTVDGMGTRPLAGALTDAEGRFELAFAPGGQATTLLAYDLGITRGALAVVAPTEVGREQRLALAPLVRVAGELSTEGGKFYPASGLCWVRDEARAACLLRVEPDKGKFAFALPPGRYVLSAQAPGRQTPSRPLELVAGAAPTLLGKIDLATHEGRVPSGGVAPPVVYREGSPVLEPLLRDRHFPGRWTLLYFWDHT